MPTKILKKPFSGRIENEKGAIARLGTNGVSARVIILVRNHSRDMCPGWLFFYHLKKHKLNKGDRHFNR